MPKDHPLNAVTPLTLKAISEYPIITYVFGFTGRSQLDVAFAKAGLEPRVVISAVDADVIKTYVRLGLGVGIIASFAFEEKKDKDLRALRAEHLFDYSVTKIGFRRSAFLRTYMYEFIQLFAPHLSKEIVERAIATKDKDDFERLFDEKELPEH